MVGRILLIAFSSPAMTRALSIVTLALLIQLSSAASGPPDPTLAIVDNKRIDAGPGDVAAVPNTDFVIAMGFNRGEAITYRRAKDGRLDEVARSPVGPEPRAMTFAGEGNLLILCNSIANELGVFEVGEDGRLREINRASSGGLNPYDVAVYNDIVVGANRDSDQTNTLDEAGYNDIIVVANRDSDQINTFHIDRRGRLTPLAQAAAGIDPHVVSVSSRGFVSVGNQTDRTISLFELNRSGDLSRRRTIPLDNMTPRTVAWSNHRLFAALDAPAPAQDRIRAFEVRDNGEIEQRGDTSAGAFLTDLEATSNELFAVTVNTNGPGGADDRDEVRVYRFEGNELVQDSAVQTPGVPPSFKQIAVGGRLPGVRHVIASEFQGGWVRSFFYYHNDDEP